MTGFDPRILAVLLLTGCAAKPAIQPEPVRVYVRTPVPEMLLEPCRVYEPDRACWRDGERVLCNGQVESLLREYRQALRECNADKAAMRTVQP